jgi:hypothetical protein
MAKQYFPGRSAFADELEQRSVIFSETRGSFSIFCSGGRVYYTVPRHALCQHSPGDGRLFRAITGGISKPGTDQHFLDRGCKLPTLIGAGYTFSFQNPNIEHGLLWNQAPAVSRGGQLNYTAGPIALSFSLNDGFYSNRYTWLTGSATYTLDNANMFALVAGGNYAHTTKSTLATPLFQNNETILNLIYIHNATPWAFATGFQSTRVPAASSIGATNDIDGKRSPRSCCLDPVPRESPNRIMLVSPGSCSAGSVMRGFRHVITSELIVTKRDLPHPRRDAARHRHPALLLSNRGCSVRPALGYSISAEMAGPIARQGNRGRRSHRLPG